MATIFSILCPRWPRTFNETLWMRWSFPFMVLRMQLYSQVKPIVSACFDGTIFTMSTRHCRKLSWRHTASHRASDKWLLVMTLSRACYKSVKWYIMCDWGQQTVLIDQIWDVSCWSTDFQYKSETCFNPTYSTFSLFQLILNDRKWKDLTISCLLAFVNALAIIYLILFYYFILLYFILFYFNLFYLLVIQIFIYNLYSSIKKWIINLHYVPKVCISLLVH